VGVQTSWLAPVRLACANTDILVYVHIYVEFRLFPTMTLNDFAVYTCTRMLDLAAHPPQNKLFRIHIQFLFVDPES
jgi:hypothetical protein